MEKNVDVLGIVILRNQDHNLKVEFLVMVMRLKISIVKILRTSTLSCSKEKCIKK